MTANRSRWKKLSRMPSGSNPRGGREGQRRKDYEIGVRGKPECVAFPRLDRDTIKVGDRVKVHALINTERVRCRFGDPSFLRSVRNAFASTIWRYIKSLQTK